MYVRKYACMYVFIKVENLYSNFSLMSAIFPVFLMFKINLDPHKSMKCISCNRPGGSVGHIRFGHHERTGAS